MRLSAVLRPLRVGSERRAVERCAVERRAAERVDRCAVPAGGGCVAHVVQSNVAPSSAVQGVERCAGGVAHCVPSNAAPAVERVKRCVSKVVRLARSPW